MENSFASEYFAALNSGNGFKNYFGAALLGIERMVILKGTPGSGKSSLMKKAAVEAEARGLRAERIFCSSDPASLDGVMIRDIKAAVIDGTAPHTADPKYPVVSETIFNTAEFMDEKKLLPHKDEIIELCEEKSSLYRTGYSYLSIRSLIRKIRHETVKKAILNDKLKSFVNRTFKKENKTNKEKSFDIAVRVSAAFGGGGICAKNTFSSAEKVYVIDDRYDIAPILLSLLLNAARSASVPAAVSPDPFDPDMLSALYLPGPKVLFAVKRYVLPTGAETVRINGERFVDKALIRQYKNKIKFLNGCIASFEEKAAEELNSAMKEHYKIEKIYMAAMDFDKMNDAANAVIKRLFSEA